MPAAAIIQNGDGGRGLLEPAGHPRRYSQQKLRGVRKGSITKRKLNGKEGDVITSVDVPKKGGSTLPSLKLNRRTIAITQLNNLDPQERVQQLIKLAEDGRKKSNTLPPLEKEASFARQPRKGGTSVTSSSLNVSDSMQTDKPMRKVSVKMDRKIVTHLKRHLNKRVQKRLDQQGDPLEYPSDEDISADGRRSQGRSMQSADKGDKGLFANYSETGEKLPQGRERRKSRPRLGKSPSRKTSLTPTQPASHDMTNGAEDHSGAVYTKASPLPGIPSGSGESSETSPGGENQAGQSSASNGVDASDVEIEVQIPTVDDEDEEEDSEFWLTEVSPIPTPTLGRPDSGSCQWTPQLDNWVRAQAVLSGIVHKTCPPDHTVIQLYLAAAYSDTAAERYFMQEHLYPALRTHCMHKGHELRIHDLHWGFKDAVSDDHQIPEVIHRVIQETHKSAHGLNFAIFLGQKSGPNLLPAAIPQQELEAIAEVAARSRDKQKAAIKIRIGELETIRADREAKAKLDPPPVEVPPSTSRLSDEAPDSARTKTTEDGGEETQPTAAEQRRSQNLVSKKEQQEMRALREEEENLPDVDLLYQWYKLDENCVPPVYRLQPISSAYKDILRPDFAKRTAAKASFSAIVTKIQAMLEDFAPVVVQNKAELQKYCSTLMEREVSWILENISSPAAATRHTAALVRTLDKCQLGVQDAAAREYMDIIGDVKTPALDAERWQRAERLRDSVVAKVPEKNTATFLLDWSADGVRPASQREHFVYAERVCKTISDLVSKQLVEVAAETDISPEVVGATNAWKIPLFQEVAEHVRVCQKLSKDFQGRKDILTVIKSYLKSEYRRPLVLHGKTGCGKSAILSKVAKEAHKWCYGRLGPPCVVVRMIGCTTDSTNVRTMLRSVCLQLCHIFGNSPTQVPTDSKGIFNDFCCRLSQASADKPLILLLDAADRLSDEHDGRKLAWLPAELPSHVHLIVSAVSDEKFDCLPCARKLLAGHDGSFVEMSKLPEDDAIKIIGFWLERAHRRLTDAQFEVLMKAFNKCPYPLFLKIIVSEVLAWSSYMPKEQLRLGESVKQVTTLRFGRLERDHGEALVRRALGYISAARNGVSVNELEDLLSLDDAVMDEVVATHKPPRRRLPVLLWTRLRMDMEDLIVETQTDGTRTLTWAHQQIRDAAEERYLLQRDKAPSYHKALSEYFLGTWAGKNKPFSGSERGTDRLVAPQDLYYDPPPPPPAKVPAGSKKMDPSTARTQNGLSRGINDPTLTAGSVAKTAFITTAGRGTTALAKQGNASSAAVEDTTPKRQYNMRRVSELPYHLIKSQQTSLLKQNCLCNYEWMLAKLCGADLRSLLEEYSAILLNEPHEPELRIISDTLHLSGTALRKEPKQLASQLVGRLNRIVTTDVPRAAGDPRKYPNLHPLIAAAKLSSIPALIPSVECLTEPGGILFDLLSGHSAPITALGLTNDAQRALTTSRDGTLKLWDVRSGKVVKSIEGVGQDITTVRTAKMNTIAVTVQLSCIRLWSLKTGTCVHTIDGYVDPASICVAAEGQLLVAVFDGSNMLRTWNMDDGFPLICEAAIPEPGYAVHKEASLLISDTSFGDLVLHAFRSGNTATVQHAKTGKVMKTLKCHERSSSITALAISREYFVVCCRQQYMSLHELISLELFDAKKGTYVRTVRGCIHDRVSQRAFTTNLIGTHAIAVSADPRNNTSDVALWNLETEDHKHLAHHPCLSTMGACLDFRFCMTGSPFENSLRVWDVSGKVNQPGQKLKKQLGVAEIWPMIENPRYVVAKAVHNGPISVWNVAKGKCLQSAVRIERGLTEGSDAMIMRNTTLVILTDRGFSSVSDDSRPVFQTVLVYDLKLKKYTRRLPGCYIVPAPSHEYVLLDNNTLLGPSDNRSHFIIWNLVTGHAASRIKTNFKELERRRMEQGAGASGQPPGGVALTDVPNRSKRGTSASMTPWDRRAESESARRRRHEKESESERLRQEELRREKDNVVEMFLVSADQSTIVASFYAHHLCVFDIASQVHTQTLQTENSMLFLHTAALTRDGGHLVLANYDEATKTSYVTLWDCGSGEVKRRLRNEANVAALAITDDASRVLIGRAPDELHIWDPMRQNSLRRVRGSGGGGKGCSVLNFGTGPGSGTASSLTSANGTGEPGGGAATGGADICKMFLAGGGTKAVVFAGDVSVWDLELGTLLAAFSPDTRVTACNVLLDGALTVFGLYDKPDLVILKLVGAGAEFSVVDVGDEGVELFGETTGDTSDEEEEEEGEEEG